MSDDEIERETVQCLIKDTRTQTSKIIRVITQGNSCCLHYYMVNQFVFLSVLFPWGGRGRGCLLMCRHQLSFSFFFSFLFAKLKFTILTYNYYKRPDENQLLHLLFSNSRWSGSLDSNQITMIITRSSGAV